MKTRNRKTPRGLAAVAVLILVSMAAGSALAQPHRGPGPEARFERLAARLDLSAEQQEAIKAIHEKNRADNLPLHKELMRLENELKGEMLKDSPSEKALLALNEKMGKIKTDLKANRLKTRLAVREQLTPEQRDKMLMMGEGRRGHGERFGGREGRDFRGHPGGPRPGRGQGMGDGTGPRAGWDCPVPEKDDQ